MKRIGYLYDKIIDKNNIRKAIINSSKGKRKRKAVFKVYNNIDYYTEKIYTILNEKTYIPSDYKTSLIYDSGNKKFREISKPRYYPDQIIHYCLIQVLEPILMKKFYLYSCGSIPGRGTSFGHKHLRKWLDNDQKKTKYCLKMDIKKFYPSINKEIMKNKFNKIIKDKDTLLLINNIVDSDCIGIPLGNYTSGWFSNFFLTDLDKYIKEKLCAKYYIRYVDDLVILDSNKKQLRKMLLEIKRFLKKEDLELKKNYQIFKIESRDIDFLGLRFFREKTILRKRNMFKVSRKAIKVSKSKKVSYKDACGVISYYGWIKHSNSYNFYINRIKPYARIKDMKKVISNYSKEKQIFEN